MPKYRIHILLLIAVFTRCTAIDGINDFFINPDMTPLKETIRRGLPLGYASRVAQLTVEGKKPSFVRIVSPCNNFPCVSVIKFDAADTDFPWFQEFDYSTITVAGLWNSPQQGLLSVLFTTNTPGTIRLFEFKTFPVQEQFAGNLLLAFNRMDINPGTGPYITVDVTQGEFNAEFDRFVNVNSLDSLIELDQEVWMMEILDQGTDDLSDDSYSLTGAGQFVTVAGEEVIALQVAALNLQLKPDCITNPVGGDILINNAGTNTNSSSVTVGMAQLQFEGNCNAKIRVNIATGSYLASFGKNLDFDLTDF